MSRDRAGDAAAMMTRLRRQYEASDLLGVPVTDVPKAALATVAFYLAQRLAGNEDAAEARRLLREEWETLRQNGIIPTKFPEPRK